MRTEQLIRCLVADLPTPSGSVSKAIATSISLSAAVSLITMLLWLGPRPEIAAAMGTVPFWMKAAYTFTIGTAGLFALERLSRPDATADTAFAIIVLSVAATAASAVGQFMTSPSVDRSQLWLGASAGICPWAIVLFSSPLLVGAFLALHQLAPTRYAAAGMAAGLMAGGYGALIYSLHCTEYGLPFLATWYTLGMLAVGCAGALLSGLLRW
ncbi:MAG: DUF1109 domain-containing protein [Hyphomicrobium sp.]|uniref:NrsF family protein n=1 Tax=Hyphomicrobium sp. TaxID=82 RepID=UPI0039E68668